MHGQTLVTVQIKSKEQYNETCFYLKVKMRCMAGSFIIFDGVSSHIEPPQLQGQFVGFVSSSGNVIICLKGENVFVWYLFLLLY